MDHSRRRKITLTHWLLIVIIAALISNAVLQTILIRQRKESAPTKAVQGMQTYEPQAAAKWLQEFDKSSRKSQYRQREIDEMLPDASKLDRESVRFQMPGSPLNSNKRDIEPSPPARRSNPHDPRPSQLPRLSLQILAAGRSSHFGIRRKRDRCPADRRPGSRRTAQAKPSCDNAIAERVANQRIAIIRPVESFSRWGVYGFGSTTPMAVPPT